MRNLKKILYPLYILLLLFGFLYVKKTLKEGNIEVQDKDNEKEETIEVKPVAVYLEIRTGRYVRRYREKMRNIDTVTDFLEKLRDSGEIFYEKTEYTYGLEFEQINNLNNPSGYKWELYHGTKKITNNAGNVLLEDDNTYSFVQEKI